MYRISHKRATRALAISTILFSTASSVADGISFKTILNDVKETTGDVLETGWRASTAPTRVLVNTGRVATGGMNASQIYQPFRRLGNSAGNTAESGTRFVTNPRSALLNEARKLARAAGGDAGQFILDVGALQYSVTNELTRANGYALGNALRGQNPLQVSAAPLAAAIRAAREQHASTARPLPDDVRNALRRYIDNATLSRAKYSVGSIEITLPNFIGRGHKFFGVHKAVVVDDIIVFPIEPPGFADNPVWWAHEVFHVKQYTQWGIERFAFNYLRDAGSRIEGEAIGFAARWDTAGSRSHEVASGFAQLGLETSLPRLDESGIEFDGATDITAPEFYVAQCHFRDDPPGLARMVTNTGKIIAVEVFTGRWMQIGWATRPLVPGVAWTYETRDRQWAVHPNGTITGLQPEFYRNGLPTGKQIWVELGFVQRLQ